MSTEPTSDGGFVRIALLIIAVIVLFPLLMMLVMLPMMGMMGWWWGGGMASSFSPLFGFVMLLVFLVVLVGLGYLLYRGLAGSGGSSMSADRALEELRLAYARGDLSDEEFEERRARLSREESQ